MKEHYSPSAGRPEAHAELPLTVETLSAHLRDAERQFADQLARAKQLQAGLPEPDAMLSPEQVVLQQEFFAQREALSQLSKQIQSYRSSLELLRMSQRQEQFVTQLEQLKTDHDVAIAAFDAAAERRAERRAQAFQVHVTCMDERDTYASEATGEPLGALELFASPGGKVTVEQLLASYGEQLIAAAGKEKILYLMPHRCGADGHDGCAAFGADEQKEYEFFSDLAQRVEALAKDDASPFFGVKVKTGFYDTDSHVVTKLALSEQVDDHGHHRSSDELVEGSAEIAASLREAHGTASKEAVGDLDRAHGGNRIYVGDTPRAWTARRNVAYHLHPGMDPKELVDGVALAVKVIKSHSHVNLETTPVVIQLDRHVGGSLALAEMSDDALIAALNATNNLANPSHKLVSGEVLIVRTETNPETWRGTITTSSTIES